MGNLPHLLIHGCHHRALELQETDTREEWLKIFQVIIDDQSSTQQPTSVATPRKKWSQYSSERFDLEDMDDNLVSSLSSRDFDSIMNDEMH